MHRDTYAHNRPTFYVDPSGFAVFESEKLAGVGDRLRRYDSERWHVMSLLRNTQNLKGPVYAQLHDPGPVIKHLYEQYGGLEGALARVEELQQLGFERYTVTILTQVPSAACPGPLVFAARVAPAPRTKSSAKLRVIVTALAAAGLAWCARLRQPRAL